jgi:hypothetical protein
VHQPPTTAGVCAGRERARQFLSWAFCYLPPFRSNRTETGSADDGNHVRGRATHVPCARPVCLPSPVGGHRFCGQHRSRYSQSCSGAGAYRKRSTPISSHPWDLQLWLAKSWAPLSSPFLASTLAEKHGVALTMWLAAGESVLLFPVILFLREPAPSPAG